MSSKSSPDSRNKKSKVVRFFDYFFVLRPTLMFPFWTMTLAGSGISRFQNPRSNVEWILLSVALSLLFGLIYLLNQLKDRNTDKLNKKLILVSEGMLTDKELWVESIMLFAISAALLIIGGFKDLWLVISGIFMIWGVLYNFTPFALNWRPWGSVFAYVFGGWLFLRLGAQIMGSEAHLIRELPYMIAFSASCIVTDIIDRKGDAAVSKKTFVVLFGEKTAAMVGSIGFIVVSILGFLNTDWVIAVPALLTAPVMLTAAIKDDIKLTSQVNKFAIFGLSIAVGVNFPVYLVIIALYYPFARWYHRQRFDMEYPSFR